MLVVVVKVILVTGVRERYSTIATRVDSPRTYTLVVLIMASPASTKINASRVEQSSDGGGIGQTVESRGRREERQQGEQRVNERGGRNERE